ncbi:peptidoglycan D,D-transpeptidase FtsI family protein [Marichromatium bheemlicum]|uniref:Peptidoglycan D,D-transpeptidase FtsI n=1 Tax=Marichromatium bheemlicum TaxID=365339 RepID=A0ABX1I5N6_9GAMM|nr:penicillin-binding protein 2 [Marichromatium bheemlicum]NKN32354.1 penicillin-binding protein 2 [Marichromatium bheemlicum]
MANPSRRPRRPLESPQRRRPNLVLRRRLLMVGLAVAFVLLGAGVFYRQVVETDFLQTEGERRYLRVAEIPARRGMISDRNGEPLAVSTPVETVWADPRKLVERLDVLPELARDLDLDPQALRERVLAKSERGFIYLKRRIDFDEARAVRELIAREHLAGVDFESEYRRFYPGAEVFGHVIGFTDIEDRGQEGIEFAHDAQLQSEPGLRRVIRDGRKRIVQEVEQLRPPRQGTDLVLSLDRRLQFLAYRELLAAVREHEAVGGTLVALDVDTGEVLAMVNQPGYNPNALRDGGSERRRNRCVTDVIEPGSTVKPLVVAAALERGLVTPTTEIDTEPGYFRVGRNLVRDVHDYGLLDVTGVLAKSSNVGVVKIAQMMEYADLWSLYDDLGFGHVTGIGFPGESPGNLRHYSDWRVFEHATLAFGYGLSVTTLQLAQAYATLAADGIKRPLTLLKREPGAVVPGTRVLSAETARAVRTMMEQVVSEKGTARRAAIAGYRVAGKTGTAKKAGPNGYAGRRYQAVFAGFAPAERPRLVMVVMIDEPHGRSYYAGVVAAPVFQKVMEGALRLFNVPPDNPPPSMLLSGRGGSAL